MGSPPHPALLTETEARAKACLSMSCGLAMLLQGLLDPVRGFSTSCKLLPGFAQRAKPLCFFTAWGGMAFGKWPCMEKHARKGGLWLDGIPQAVPLASGRVDPRQPASVHTVAPSVFLPARGPGLRGQAGAGCCNGAGESRAAGTNWVIRAPWFGRMKNYKMPINIMRCLTVLCNVLVLFSLVCICKGIPAKGTIIVNIQKGKFWVMCPVLSWKNYI